MQSSRICASFNDANAQNVHTCRACNCRTVAHADAGVSPSLITVQWLLDMPLSSMIVHAAECTANLQKSHKIGEYITSTESLAEAGGQTSSNKILIGLVQPRRDGECKSCQEAAHFCATVVGCSH